MTMLILYQICIALCGLAVETIRSPWHLSPGLTSRQLLNSTSKGFSQLSTVVTINITMDYYTVYYDQGSIRNELQVLNLSKLFAMPSYPPINVEVTRNFPVML